MSAGVKPLTDVQREVLLLIQSWLDRTGHPPTLLEICTALGIRNISVAEYHIRVLERKGWIEPEVVQP